MILGVLFFLFISKPRFGKWEQQQRCVTLHAKLADLRATEAIRGLGKSFEKVRGHKFGASVCLWGLG